MDLSHDTVGFVRDAIADVLCAKDNGGTYCATKVVSGLSLLREAIEGGRIHSLSAIDDVMKTDICTTLGLGSSRCPTRGG
jgi:hypothetical protein